MKLAALSSIAIATALASAAFAQPAPDGGAAAPPASDAGSGAPPVVASQPVPDTSAPSPGIPSDRAVNPAPGASGPYVGAGKNAFYDVDARLAHVTESAAALPAAQRRKVQAALKSIKAEEATQIARHGQLRDWDRENMNYKLDQLVQQYPSLGPSSGVAAPGAEPQ